MIKSDIFEVIFGKEGGYVNYFDDKGGLICWGIIEKVVCVYGYIGDMCNLLREIVLVIFEVDYWIGLCFDQIVGLLLDIVIELCDIGVNMGLLVFI